MADTLYPTPGTGNARQVNAGAWNKAKYSGFGTVGSQTAAPTGTKLTGPAINRCNPNVALSAKVVIPAHIVQASGHSVVLARTIEHSADNSSWSTYSGGGQPDDITITANNDGSAVQTDVGFNADLSGAKEYIRVTMTPDFSASGTDIMYFGCAVVLDGYDTNPPA